MAAPHDQDVDVFRDQTRAWLAANMPRAPHDRYVEEQMGGDGVRARELQRRLFDGGYAGLCFPVEYGGQGLSYEHQLAFNDETGPYEMPIVFNIPTFTIIAPTILEFGTEEQRQRHLPAILRGDELWVQFLSEPSGGSDLAGLVTRAERDGETFVLNGSKVWSSGAHRADHALCLARTNWDVPKHDGLTMFLMAIHQPGVEVNRIRMSNESHEFCQEYFSDLAIPVRDVLGEVDGGWTVARELLGYERSAMAGSSPYQSGISSRSSVDPVQGLIRLARATGRTDDPRVREMIGEVWANEAVQRSLIARVGAAVESRRLPPDAGSLTRLSAATNRERIADIGLAIAGAAAASAGDDDFAGEQGVAFLMRQMGSLGGGSSEMQRNLISERVYGMPRELAADRGKPFREVRHN
ncbi:MAG: acyl-CoA dehydrogenase family protein [Acidimicrobiales bacterium]